MLAVVVAAPVDAYDVFARARAVWAAQRYPAHLSYTVAVHVSEGGVEKSNHYHLSYDGSTQTVFVNAVSDEELAAPVAPKGFALHLQPRRQGRVLFDKTVGRPPDAVDYLGVPKISPAYSFGMIAHSGTLDDERSDALIEEIRSEFHDPMPAEKAQYLPSHAVIANVVSRTNAYTIRLAGIDRVDDGDCYHLLLQPNANPRRFRLREAWVDTLTFQTRRLIVANNFSASPQVPWMVTFAQHDGAVYIASETAQGRICVDAHCYERASIAFESIAPSNAAPMLHSWFLTPRAILSEP